MLLGRRGNDQADDKRRRPKLEGKLGGGWAAAIDTVEDKHLDPRLIREPAHILVFEL